MDYASSSRSSRHHPDRQGQYGQHRPSGPPRSHRDAYMMGERRAEAARGYAPTNQLSGLSLDERPSANSGRHSARRHDARHDGRHDSRRPPKSIDRGTQELEQSLMSAMDAYQRFAETFSVETEGIKAYAPPGTLGDLWRSKWDMQKRSVNQMLNMDNSNAENIGTINEKLLDALEGILQCRPSEGEQAAATTFNYFQKKMQSSGSDISNIIRRMPESRQMISQFLSEAQMIQTALATFRDGYARAVTEHLQREGQSMGT